MNPDAAYLKEHVTYNPPVHMEDVRREWGEYVMGTTVVTQIPVACAKDIVEVVLVGRFGYVMPTTNVKHVTCVACQEVIAEGVS